MEIPLKGPVSHSERQEDAVEQAPTGRARCVRVLVLDDDIGYREIVTAALGRHGAELHWRGTATELFLALEETEPSMLILSRELADSHPLEALRAVRRSPRWSQLSVYFVTDEPDTEFELEAYLSGADAVLDRRRSGAELSARVRGYLLRGKADDPAAERSNQVTRTAARGPEQEASEAGASPPPDLPQLAGTAPRPAEPLASAEGATGVPDVIIVEDDPSLLEMLEYALKNRGLTTHSFTDGVSALQGLREWPVRNAHPVVLLDVDLPGMDGFQILQQLEEFRPNVFRVMLCTIHNSEAAQVLALQTGAVDYLTKPLRMPVLVAKVERLVRALSAPKN
jgi:DNA-binding response OmpR family regulator